MYIQITTGRYWVSIRECPMLLREQITQISLPHLRVTQLIVTPNCVMGKLHFLLSKYGSKINPTVDFCLLFCILSIDPWPLWLGLCSYNVWKGGSCISISSMQSAIVYYQVKWAEQSQLRRVLMLLLYFCANISSKKTRYIYLRKKRKTYDIHLILPHWLEVNKTQMHWWQFIKLWEMDAHGWISSVGDVLLVKASLRNGAAIARVGLSTSINLT